MDDLDDLEVSKNRAMPLNTSNFHGIFPNKNHPASLGLPPWLNKPPDVHSPGGAASTWSSCRVRACPAAKLLRQKEKKHELSMIRMMLSGSYQLSYIYI